MDDAGPEPAPAPRRRGRPAGSRAGDQGTRERILAAARAVFAERGYDRASVRAIAKSAEVDAALVHHYFGAKEQVFEAAIEVSFAPALNVPEVLAGGSGNVGERLARYFLSVWQNPVTRTSLLAVLRSAVTNETAAAVLRGFVLRRVLLRVAGELDLPDARLRAELAASQMIGIALLRYVLKVEPLASAPDEEIVALVGPALQRYLTAE
jgi:AcrR family transcriptional regulator